MFFGGDPFEHFAGMHGGPGGGSRRSAAPPRDVDTTKLYETLGVSESFLSFFIIIGIQFPHVIYQCCVGGTVLSDT